jgi:hypothetical protein
MAPICCIRLSWSKTSCNSSTLPPPMCNMAIPEIATGFPVGARPISSPWWVAVAVKRTVVLLFDGERIVDRLREVRESGVERLGELGMAGEVHRREAGDVRGVARGAELVRRRPLAPVLLREEAAGDGNVLFR